MALIIVMILLFSTVVMAQDVKFNEAFPGLCRFYTDSNKVTHELFAKTADVTGRIVKLNAKETWMDYRLADKFHYLALCIEKRLAMTDRKKVSQVRVNYKGKYVALVEYNPIADLPFMFKDMSGDRVQYFNWE